MHGVEITKANLVQVWGWSRVCMQWSLCQGKSALVLFHCMNSSNKSYISISLSS